MKLIIKNILLYPVNKKLKPRNLTFDGSKINIITGYSKRGKSSIIEIIDYCLGNTECGIPIGEIRNLVDVFALKISIDGQDFFIGRDSPRNSGQNSTNMYFIEIDKLGEYEQLKTNAWILNKEEFSHNRESIKNKLNSYGNFQNLDDLIANTEEGITVGFRDTTAFQFQSQSIIANGNTIFFNTDDFYHQNRLKKLFPLVLGYKSYEMLLLEEEIQNLENDWGKLSGKIEDIKVRYENWQSDLYEYYIESIKLGLTNRDIDISLSNVDLIKAELEGIISDVKKNILFKGGNSLRFSEKIEELENSRVSLSRELNSKKMEFTKILKFENTKKEYLENVYVEIKDRLKPIDWFLNRKGTDICPFCDSKSDKALVELQRLKEAREINSKLMGVDKSNDLSFEKEKSILKKNIKEQEIIIEEFDKNIGILLADTKEEQFIYQKIYEFVGKVSNFIQNLITPDSALIKKLQKLEEELNKKRTELNKLKLKYDKDHILSKVTKSIKTYVDLLPIEHKNHCDVLIDPEKYLGIKIKDEKNKSITFLNKIGSGSNYMCYHMATMLGLHEYFYKLKETGKLNYVPSFLVLDQPSQVYYPEILKKKQENGEKLEEKDSEDLENTRNIFEVCSTFMERTNNEIQIIILEHAPQETWSGINNINVVDEWRGKESDGNYSEDYKALIPKSWLID